MAGRKSGKETRQNYTIQPFLRQSFDAKYFVQLLAFLLFLKFLGWSNNLAAIYYAFNPP